MQMQISRPQPLLLVEGNVRIKKKPCLQFKKKLRGGGCGSSIDQVGEHQNFPPLPVGLATKLKEYTTILVEKATLLLDQNQKDDALIAIQWFYFNKQHFDTLCYKYQEASQIYELILESVDQLLKQSSSYLRVSGVLCISLLQICNDLIRVIFSFLMRDRKNKNRYLEIQYKEQLLQYIHTLEGLLESESQNVYLTGVEFELQMLNTALEHIPTNSTKKQELFSQFMNGMFESIFQLSPSEGLIKALIEIGSTIIIDKYNTHFKYKIRKYEIYYFFETLKWTTINQLRLQFSQQIILNSLEEGYKQYVLNSEDWLIHFCWLQMISDLLCFRPIVDKNDFQLEEFMRKQWNFLIQVKQIVPLPYNPYHARITFKNDSQQQTGLFSKVIDSYQRFFNKLMQLNISNEIKLWDHYISFSFKPTPKKDQNLLSINQLFFGNFEIKCLQHQNKLADRLHNDLVQYVKKIQQQLSNFYSEKEQSDSIFEIYAKEIDDLLKALKQQVINIVQLIIYQKLFCRLIREKCIYLSQIINSRNQQINLAKKDDIQFKKKKLRNQELCQQIKDIEQCENNLQKEFNNFIDQIPEIAMNFTILQKERDQMKIFLAIKNKKSFSKPNLSKYQKSFDQLKTQSEEFQKRLVLLQKTYFKFFNKGFQFEKYAFSKNYFDLINEISTNQLNFVKEIFKTLAQKLHLLEKNPETLIEQQKNNLYERYLKSQYLNNNYSIFYSIIQLFQVIRKRIFDGLKKITYQNMCKQSSQSSQLKEKKIKTTTQDWQAKQLKEIQIRQKQSIMEFIQFYSNSSQDFDLDLMLRQFQEDQHFLQHINDQFDKNRTFQVIQFLLNISQISQESQNLEKTKLQMKELYLKDKNQEQTINSTKNIIDQNSNKLNKVNSEQSSQEISKIKEQLNFSQTDLMKQFWKILKGLSLQLQKLSSFFLLNYNNGRNTTQLDQNLQKMEINLKKEFLDYYKNFNDAFKKFMDQDNVNISEQMKEQSVQIFAIKEYFDVAGQFTSEELQDLQNDQEQSIFQILRQNLQQTLNKQLEKPNLKENDFKVRECLAYNLIKIQSLVSEPSIVSFSQEVVQQIWGRERDSRVKKLLCNTEMINLQKKMFSQDLKLFSQKLNEAMTAKLKKLQSLEFKLIQEGIQQKKEEIKKQLTEEYEEFDNYVDGISDMSSKLDINFQFLKEIRQQLIQVSAKLDQISANVDEIGKDVRKLKGKTFQELLLIRKEAVIEQQKQYDLRNIFVYLRTQEWNTQNGAKIEEETRLISRDVNDHKAEVNQFIYCENEKYIKDTMLIRGNAGSGKSRAAKKIEEYLWRQQLNEQISSKHWIPIFISLPTLREPRFNIISQALESDFYRFDQMQIKDFKDAVKNNEIKIVLILDSYDEMKSEVIQKNLYLTNNLKSEFLLPNETYSENFKKFKLIFTTRNEILSSRSYQIWFCGHDVSTLKEVELLHFDKEQSTLYLNKFTINNVKSIFLDIYEIFIQIKKLQFNHQNFKEFWKLIKPIFKEKKKENQYENKNEKEEQKQKSDQLLTQEQINKLSQKMQEQAIFENASQDQITNLTKELISLWSVSKYQNTIDSTNIQSIISTPFMMEIVVQVLPGMIQYYSQIQQIKDFFFLNFPIVKQQCIREMFYLKYYSEKNTIKNQKPSFLNENQLQELTKTNWDVLENKKFFQNFQLNSNFKLDENGDVILEYQKQLEQNQDGKVKIGEDTLVILKTLKKHNLTNYDFYETFVQFYHNKQIQKLMQQGKKINEECLREDLMFYSENLALDLTKNQLTQVSYKVKGKLNLKQNLNVDNLWVEQYFNDLEGDGEYKKIVRSCTLILQKGSNFSFTHKSIQEFFVAKQIIELFEKLKFIPNKQMEIFLQLYKKNESISKTELLLNLRDQKQICDDFSEADFNNIWEQLIDWVKNGIWNQTELNISGETFQGCFNLMRRKLKNINNLKKKLIQILDLSKVLLSFTFAASNSIFVLTQINEYFGDTDLSNIKIANTNLSCASFYNVNLEGSQFFNIDINQCNFNYANLSNVSWQNINLQNSYKFDGHKLKINDIKFFQKQFAATCGDDALIFIWDLKNFKSVHKFSHHTKKINQLAIAQKEQMLISVSEDKYVMLYSLEQDKYKKISGLCLEYPLYSVIFYASEMVYIGSKFGLIQVSFKNNQLKLKNEEHCQYEIVALAVSNDYSMYALGQNDVILIDFGKDSEKNLLGHKDKINCLQFLPNDKNSLASGSADRTIIVWNIQTRNQLQIIQESQSQIQSISILQDESQKQQILSFVDEKQVYIWDLLAKKIIKQIPVHKTLITVSQLIKNEQNEILILFGNDNGMIRFQRIESSNEYKNQDSHCSEVTTLSISPDGLKLVSGSNDKSIKIWNLETGQLENELIQQESEISQVQFSKNGKMLAIISNQEIVNLWDANLYQLLNTLDLRENIESSATEVIKNQSQIKSMILENEFITVKKSSEESYSLITSIISLNQFQEIQFVFGNQDGQIIAMKNESSQKLNEIEKTPVSSVSSLDFAQEFQILCCGWLNGQVGIYCFENNQFIYYEEIDDPIFVLKTFQHQQYFLTGHSEGYVRKFSYSIKDQSIQHLETWYLGEGSISTINIIENKPCSKAYIGSEDSLIYLINFGDRNYKTFHEELSYSLLEISSKGTYLAAARNSDIYLWNAEKKTCKINSDLHQEDITAICFSENEQAMISGGEDDLMHLWHLDVNNNNLIKVGSFYGHSSSIIKLHFFFFKSEQEEVSILVSSSQDDSVRGWNVDEQDQVFRIKVEMENYFNIHQIKKLNELVLISQNDENVRINIYDVNKFSSIFLHQFKYEGQIIASTIQLDGQNFAIGAKKMIRIINRKDQNFFEIQFNFKIIQIQFSLEYQDRLYIQKKESLAFCSLQTPKRVPENLINEFNDSLISFSQSSNQMAYCKKSSLGIVNLDDYQKKNYFLRCKESEISAFSSCDNEEYFAAGKTTGIITIWQVSNEKYYHLEWHQKRVTFLKFINNTQLLSASWDGKIILSSIFVEKHSILSTLDEKITNATMSINQSLFIVMSKENDLNNELFLEFSNDSSTLVFRRKSGELKFYNIQENEYLKQFKGVQDKTYSTAIAFSEKDYYFAYSDGENNIILQTVEQPSAQLKHHKSEITTLNFYKQEILVSGSFDMLVCIWSLGKKTEVIYEISDLNVPIHRVFCCTTSPILVVCGKGKKILLRHLKEQKNNYIFEAHQSNVNAIEISPCETILASAGDDFCIKLWKMKEDNILTLLRNSKQNLFCYKTIGQMYPFEAYQVKLQNSSITNKQGESLLANFSPQQQIRQSKIQSNQQ